VKSADRKYRATLYAPKSGRDNAGRAVTGWEKRFSERVAVRFLRGGEEVQAARLRGEQPVVATVRLTPTTLAIGASWRMDIETVGTFNVRAVVPTDDRRNLEITAQMGVEV